MQPWVSAYNLDCTSTSHILLYDRRDLLDRTTALGMDALTMEERRSARNSYLPNFHLSDRSVHAHKSRRILDASNDCKE